MFNLSLLRDVFLFCFGQNFHTMDKERQEDYKPSSKEASKLQIQFKCDRIFIYDVLLYVISLMQNRGEGGLKSGPEDS